MVFTLEVDSWLKRHAVVPRPAEAPVESHGLLVTTLYKEFADWLAGARVNEQVLSEPEGD